MDKKIYSLVALAACSTIFADKPVAGSLEKTPCKVVVDASFLYWYAAQDGMNIATSGGLQTTTAVSLENGGQSLTQKFAYDPGFKLGVGFIQSDWEFHAEYTWIRSNTFVNSTAPADNSSGGEGVWLMNDWFAQGIGSSGSGVSATNVTSRWRLGIDVLDITASRPFCLNKNVSITPYGGVKAAWIRQSLNIGATVPVTALTVGQRPLSSQPTYSRNHTNSWGLGPVFGMDARCLLGQGIRLQGKGDISLLFTQYTKLYHSEDAASSTATPSLYSMNQSNYNTLRPIASLGLGLGWGRAFYGDKYYIDFSADYDFNVLWNQNMMRSFVSEIASGSSSNNDLFLHGLTITGRFDF